MDYVRGNVIKAAITSVAVCFTVLTTAELFYGSAAISSQSLLAASSDPRRIDLSDPVRGNVNGKLVFSSDRHNSGGLSIWTMNSGGSSPTRLTDEKSRTERLPAFAHVLDRDPAWSPDGTKIAFISNRDYLSALYVMNADGGSAQLVTDQVPNPASPAWSPDGRKIALGGGSPTVVEPNKPFYDIYVINVDGSGLSKLTSDSGLNGTPSWSPDGHQIVFGSNRDADGRWKIWVMNAEGSNQRRLTDVHNTKNPMFYSDSMPSWSPDGSNIVFNGYRDFNGTRNCFAVNCSELFVMNADGSNDHPITNDPNRRGLYMNPRWSPDGAKIVTSIELGKIGDSESQGRVIIVMNADGSNQLNLSNRSDRVFFDVAPDWQSLSVPSTEPPSSVLSFGAPTFSAYEDSGSISITVKRAGNLNATASCYYATADGTATAKNYGPAFGILRFANGEASKTISIPVTDNAAVQGNISFKINLFDNEGNATFIGGIREATVTVLDKDIVPRNKSPIDDTYYFVRQHYVDFLNREPDPDGLAFWVNQIESCGSDQQCREVRRINVSAAFYLSTEFQEVGSFVYRFELLNPSDVNYGGLLGIIRGMQEIGGGIIVGQPGWQEQLQANKLAFVQHSYDDNRLALSYGRTNEEWIDLLFQYINMYTGVSLPEAKRDALVNGLDSGMETRPTAMIRVLDDEQFKAALFNQVFVLMQYYGYLRRDPEDEGYSFWLKKLNAFNGDYQAAEMVKAFLVSSEYRQRFGP